MTQDSYREHVPPALLHLFTAITGLVDAVSFIGLGHIFTANMTGNIVFLGFAVVGVPGLSVPRSLVALVAFMLGALIAGRMAMFIAPISPRKWVIMAFGTEALLLLMATLASTAFRSSSTGVIPLYAVIVFTAAAMGVRNATVRKIAHQDLTTTVLTLTITGLAADSSFAGGADPRWQRRALSVLLMFAGASVGALLLKRSLTLPLAAATLATVCAVADFYRRRQTFVAEQPSPDRLP
jgi:uncharacterized membrane protein YoaK (UPF0700 family)